MSSEISRRMRGQRGPLCTPARDPQHSPLRRPCNLYIDKAISVFIGKDQRKNRRQYPINPRPTDLDESGDGHGLTRAGGADDTVQLSGPGPEKRTHRS